MKMRCFLGGMAGGIMLTDAAPFAILAFDPVLQFNGRLVRVGKGFLKAYEFLGKREFVDALQQVAVGIVPKDLTGAIVDIDQRAVFDNGQTFLDVFCQVAEALLAPAGGRFCLLVLHHLQGQFQIQARQFVLVDVGAFLEFAIELQEIGFETVGGGDPPGGNRGRFTVRLKRGL